MFESEPDNPNRSLGGENLQFDRSCCETVTREGEGRRGGGHHRGREEGGRWKGSVSSSNCIYDEAGLRIGPDMGGERRIASLF